MGVASSGFPVYPGQNVTHRCQAVSLERGIEQHRAPVAQGLHCVGLQVSVLILQTVKVSRLVLTLLLLQNTDVRMGFTLLWAVQEEVSFPRTLGIGDNDVRRNHRRHEDPLHSSAVVTLLDIGHCQSCRIGYPCDAVTPLCPCGCLTSHMESATPHTLVDPEHI